MLAIAIATTVAALSPSQASSFAVRADKVWLGDGRVLENAIVVVENGKIERVDEKSGNAGELELIEHKGTLTAGLVALRTQLGLSGEASDETRNAMPDAQVGIAFSPDARDFELARALGVTTVVLAPQTQGVCGGITAVVKTAGRNVLSPRAHLVLGMGADSLGFNREPTSYPGQIAMLDALFERRSGAISDAIEDAKQRRLPCYFEVSARPDVVRAIEFAKKHGLRGALVGASLSGEVADDIKESKLPVVVPTLASGAERRELKSVLELAKKGVPFGFTGDAPFESLSNLRVGAVMLVREGVSPQTVWSALTSEAARIAGVGDRVGRIAAGLDADLVLWSGDPLDLGSRIEAVYVDGRRVAGGGR